MIIIICKKKNIISYLKISIIILIILTFCQMIYGQSNSNNESIKSDKSSWLLNASQENETLLKNIGKYIETFYGVDPSYYFNGDDNLVLTYDQKIGDSPEIKIYIESIPIHEIKDGENYKVLERRIRISTYINISEFIDNETFRNNLMELNNKWHNRTWIPHRIYITTGGSIAMQSSINIPGEDFPIPIEQLKDLISRTLNSWEEYSKELLEILN